MILAADIIENLYSIGTVKGVFGKSKCEQKGLQKVSPFSPGFHDMGKAFPEYQMLTL